MTPGAWFFLCGRRTEGGAMKRFGLVLAGLLSLAASTERASAQWMHDKGEDDPFAGGEQHLALALSSSGEMIGFRCTKEADLALLFVSIEKPEPEHIRLFSMLPAKLRVIVDDEEPESFPASIDVTPDGGRYRFTAEGGLVSLVRAAQSAKRRFAVAAEVNDERIYSAAVSVRGSGRAIGKLAEGCKLP